MNKVILMGRLVRDPDVRYSHGRDAIAIARCTIAVNRARKIEGQPSADFINCVAIGKIGELAEKYFRRGMKIVVTGSWQTGNYTDKNGNKIYTNECLIESFEFAESKTITGNTNNNGYAEQYPRGTNRNFVPMIDDTDDDLPFC